MKRISARYLLGFTTDQLWDTLVGKFILVMDDGVEIQTGEREVCFSSYFWDFHRKYPNTKLLSSHHIQSVLKGSPLNTKSHIDLLCKIYWDVADTYQMRTPAERDSLTKMVYEVTNTIYVEMIKRSEASVTSIDILDLIEVIEHPEIKPALDALSFNSEKPDTDYGRMWIDNAYTTLKGVLSKSPSLAHNALAHAFRSKTVNDNQVMQCVGPRGFLTHVDGYVIPVPVLESYTTGMKSLYNLTVESQSASKSLYFSESPLQDSEYFARRLQLMTMVVETLHYVDCGSKDYVLWHVKPAIKDGKGKEIYPGDVKFMEGKFYLDETTNTLKEIKKSDTHLFNKTIKLRSVLKCKHPDPHGVCMVCFGKLSDNLTMEQNLGHVCAATMTQQTSQSVLSTKHLDASSSTEVVVLSEEGKRFFNVGRNGNTIFLRNDLSNFKNLRLMVSQKEAFALTDILLVQHVDAINPTRVSEIDYVGVSVEHNGIQDVTPICVSQNGRYAMFTHDFLRYLKLHHWSSDNKGNFIFDLENWDTSKPIFTLPEMEYSFSAHSHQVAKIIESSMEAITTRMKPNAPESTLVELFDLVNAKLNVNIAALEVILYASMIKNGAEDDFGLARGSETASLGVSDQTLRNRSLSAAYTYEKQLMMITDPQSFYKQNRPDSVFDVFIHPLEVLQQYRRY